MKKLIIILFFVISVITFAQSWQNKTVARLQSVGSSIKVVFSDSAYAYIQKTKIVSISDMPNSTYVQIAYTYDQSTQRTISFPYNSITQPVGSSAKDLSSKLNDLLQ